jgi:hypothetical protein
MITSYVSLRDIEHAFLQVQSRTLVHQDGQTNNPVSDFDIIRSLCDRQNFFDAINLATHSTNSTASNLSLETTIHSLAAQAATLTSPNSTLHVIEEQFLSSLGCVPFPLLDALDPEEKILWKYLVNILRLVDDPSGGLKLHQVACRAALSLSQSRENRLPQLFISSYCGNEIVLFPHQPKYSRGNQKTEKGNLDSLIRTLLSQGCLLDACRVVSDQLSLHFDGKKSKCFPINAIDQVLIACEKALQITTEEENRTLLRENYDQVRESIGRYFTELFVAEIGT